MQLPTYVGGHGSSSAKLMIVAEAPGYYEDKEGIPMVGPSGQLVNEMLRIAGTRREDVYITNVVKYRPPNNDLKRLHEIGVKVEDGIPQLWEEIRTIAPNAIIPMGNLALRTITGKDKILTWRGSILETIYGAPKCIPTIHPAALFKEKGTKGRGGSLPWRTKQYIQADINRAVEESQSKEFDLPRRLLEICKNSAQLDRFLDRYKHKRRVAVDIESHNTIPLCISLCFESHHPISIPLFDPLDELGVPSLDILNIWQTLAIFFDNPELEVIGQNFKYDHRKLEQVCGIKIRGKIRDTMLLAGVVHPEFPKALDFLTSIYTKEPYYKTEGKEFVLGKDPITRLMEYNCKDSAVTLEIYEQMVAAAIEMGVFAFYEDFVCPLHHLYMAIEREGLRTSRERRLELWDKYDAWEKREEKELLEIANIPINVQSPKQVSQLLYGQLRFPNRGSTDEDTLVSLLGTHAKTTEKKRAIELILNLRRIKKTKSTYINSPTDFDGRTRTSYRITGTETGRTSTAKLEPPLRPWLWVRQKDAKGKFVSKKKGIGHAFQTETKHGDIGSDLRSRYIADEGETLVEFDQSQAEARVVALLAEDYELLALFGKTDIHKLTASWFFGVAPSEVTKEMRFIGKIGRHGGNYDMGAGRLQMEIMSNARRFHIDVSVSLWKCKQIIEIFHKFSPKIRGVFHESVKKALFDNSYTLVSPHGRPRQFFERPDDDLFKEAFATIPQATVSDHTKECLLILKERYPWLRIIGEAHDAGIFSIPDERVEEMMPVIKDVFERPIDFANCSVKRGSLVIPCEAKTGKNYKDLVDYKFAA